ncbi:MAG TPA: M20/M25/M40 family metallo-hydrolase [Pilimelia sp.]|nr:M20/M25/M40 family metallo-hydrolase [Pilimelia sp.]
MLSIAAPAPRPVDAPAGDFSAERAHAHLGVVAAQTHVAGSAAGDRARDHILGTLRGLGVPTDVQDVIGPEAGELSGGAGATTVARVRNVVGMLSGSAPTGRVFLVAHYDSVQVGPGGNDDAAGVAATLEIARALAAGPRPRNDIVFVLTDAEEACLCGAAAFVERHPLAAGGGVALNLEARGSTGPVVMFETSSRNAALVRAFARAAPHPVGTSFAVEVYRLLPNDTDFTAFLANGFAGLNSAYIDGAAVYHTPLDTPASVDRASLQHHGDNGLGLARELGAADLRNLDAGEDATYFPVPGGLVHYPGGLTWPLALLGLAAVVALAWLGRLRGLLTLPRLAAATGLALLPLVVAPAAAQLLWAGVLLVRPGYAELLDPYRPLWYRLAVLALTASVLAAWYALLRRRLGPAAMAVGGLGLLAILGLLLAATVPGGSYLAVLPALAGALTGIAAVGLAGGRAGLQRRDERDGDAWAVAAVAVGAVVAVLVLLPAVILLFPALGMAMGGAAALLAAMLGLAALPVLDLLHPEAGGQRAMAAVRARRAGAYPAALALLAAIAFVGTGLRVDQFDAAHPAPAHLMYALDAGTRQAQWLSRETDPQPWTSQYVRGPADVDERFPVLATGTELLAGPAESANLPAPALTVTSDAASGDVRTLRLRLRPQRPVRMVGLYLDARTGTIDRATVAGYQVPVDRVADERWSFGLMFHAPPADGIELELALRPPAAGGSGGQVRFRVLDGSDGLAGLPGFQPRPPGVGIAASHTSELVLVADTATIPPPV